MHIRYFSLISATHDIENTLRIHTLFILAFIHLFQVAEKLQLTGQGGNKRSLDDRDNEPHSKRFSGGSDWSNSSMSPAHLQQAQQAAAQVAARLGGGPQSGNYHQQNASIPNPEAVQKAKELIQKMVPQTNNMGPGPGAGGGSGGPGPNRAGLGSNSYDEIMIPGSKVGLIIGKGGETIKQLQVRPNILLLHHALHFHIRYFRNALVLKW